MIMKKSSLLMIMITNSKELNRIHSRSKDRENRACRLWCKADRVELIQEKMQMKAGVSKCWVWGREEVELCQVRILNRIIIVDVKKRRNKWRRKKMEEIIRFSTFNLFVCIRFRRFYLENVSNVTVWKMIIRQ